jgi:hypothetical protein
MRLTACSRDIINKGAQAIAPLFNSGKEKQMPMFNFLWEEFDFKSGKIESVCTQLIYGKDSIESFSNFIQIHGELTPDENGIAIRIVKMEYDDLESELRIPWESES